MTNLRHAKWNPEIVHSENLGLKTLSFSRKIETHTETHRDRQTRGTHTLRETPSSRKRHTLLRARSTHTH